MVRKRGKKNTKNDKSWILAAAISLIISVIINFNDEFFWVFLIKALILWLPLTGTSFLIIKSIHKIKEKNIQKGILFVALSIFAIVISLFVYIFLNLMLYSGICEETISLHFRTNTFTGQCSIWSNGCDNSDFWYYKPGCDISVEKKVEILQKSEWYDGMRDWCNMLCETNLSERYCSYSLLIMEGISCNDLTECPSTSC